MYLKQSLVLRQKENSSCLFVLKKTKLFFCRRHDVSLGACHVLNYNVADFQAVFCRDYVFQAMKDLREPADKLEMLVDEENWPFPTYGELLYNI